MKVNEVKEYLIIGDIAGNYDPLLKLIEKAHKVYPKAIPFSLGDMCDRGPKSKDVILYFKENGIALMGNHEHMLLDFYHENGFYDDDIWFYNGGGATARSLAPNKKSLSREEARAAIKDSGIVEYLENLIYFFETAPRDDGLRALITHAPLLAGKDLYQACVLLAGPV